MESYWYTKKNSIVNRIITEWILILHSHHASSRNAIGGIMVSAFISVKQEISVFAFRNRNGWLLVFVPLILAYMKTDMIPFGTHPYRMKK